MVVIWVGYAHFYNKNNFGNANVKHVYLRTDNGTRSDTIVFIKEEVL